MTTVKITIPIIYQDDSLLVVNKPPGLVVNRAQTVDQLTLQDWIEEQEFYKTDNLPDDEKTQQFLDRSGIAHRLDKDTSGLLIIAKSTEALQNLLKQFKQRKVHKSYTALVHGKFASDQGEVDLPIGRNSRDRLKFTVRADGRPSQTKYTVENFFPHINMDLVIQNAKRRSDFQQQKQDWQEKTGRAVQLKRSARVYQGFSLLHLFPLTGRTHQIRVHMAHLQHPLVGDRVYVGKKRLATDQFWCPRHFLHAANLKFSHPITNKLIELHAPLPEDLQQALTFLHE